MFEIAGMVCPSDVFLAPMAGYTNYPFRRMCADMGAGLTFTEMVSAKGLHYENPETRALLYAGDIRPQAAQIFGSDPDLMREACESEALAPFDLIDLNFGCPMPKIVKNGDGSALLENLPLLEKIVAACVKSGKRISAKVRIGIEAGLPFAAEIAKRCEGGGACMLTVHGRTRDKIYAGEPNYAEIAAAKNAVSIPVVANGGIRNAQDAAEMKARTGADAVMVARAALYDPRLFCEVSGIARPPLDELFLRQLRETETLYGARFATVFMRKMAAFYLRGTRGAAAAKNRLFSAQSPEEVKELAVSLLRGL